MIRATNQDKEGEGVRIDEPRIAIVMPIFNAMRFLETTIPAAVAAVKSYRNAELILVDNGSTDGSLQYIRTYADQSAKVVEEPGITISAVRNSGARNSDAELFAFVDADCIVSHEYLEAGLAALRISGAAVTGSAYALPQMPGWIEAAWHRLHSPPNDGDVAYINGGNLLCWREAFEDVGGFNETLTTGEDAELCLRFRTAGYRIHSSKAVRCEHLGNPKTLGAFFRKQRWHALGSFGTWRLKAWDKPILMTAGFLGCVIVGVVLLFLKRDFHGLLMFMGLVTFIPVVAVLYRSVRNRIWPPLIKGIVLYTIYFVARCAGISAAVVRRRGESYTTQARRLRG